MSEIMSDMRTAAAAAETALGPLVGTGFLGSAPQAVGAFPGPNADTAIAGPIGPFVPLAGAGHEILLQGYTSGFSGIGLTSMTVQIETSPTGAPGTWTPVGRTQVSGIPETGTTAATLLEGYVTAYIHPATTPLFVRLAFTTTPAGAGAGAYSTVSAIEGMIAAQQL